MFMTNFILLLLVAALSNVHAYTNVGSCGGSNDLTLDDAGCVRHFDGRDDTCTNDAFNMYYDGCQRSCQAHCHGHPMGRDARCDDGTIEECRIRDLTWCSHDCGRDSVFTAVYTACAASTQEPIICPDFCCCGVCEGPGNPYNNPICTCTGQSPRPIPPYKSCADRDSPINTAVCNNLCPHVECAAGEIIGGDDGCSCVPPVPPPTPTCHAGMHLDSRVPGSCFVHVATLAGFQTARASCINDYDGAWLIELTDAARFNMVSDMVANGPLDDWGGAITWVGGRHDANDLSLAYWMTHSNNVLIDGSYITWIPGEPNNDPSQEYICMLANGLADCYEAAQLPYICEYCNTC